MSQAQAAAPAAQARTPGQRQADYAEHALRRHARDNVGSERTVQKLFPADAGLLVQRIDADRARIAELEAALHAVESALDGKRNRFGKLEGYTCRDTEPLRLLACQHDIGGSADLIEQAVKVARAVLERS